MRDPQNRIPPFSSSESEYRLHSSEPLVRASPSAPVDAPTPSLDFFRARPSGRAPSSAPPGSPTTSFRVVRVLVGVDPALAPLFSSTSSCIERV